MMWLIIAVAVVGLYMAWNIGANDVANSMADAVGSKSITVRNAVIAAAICEFAGAVLVGGRVTDTVRKGIVSPEALAGAPEVMAVGMACALLAAAIWLNVATVFGLPVSTTHSIVGAVAGFGIIAAGWAAVQWGTMGKIVASWFISPLAGAAMAFCTFKLIRHYILARDNPIPQAMKFTPVVVFFMFLVVILATLYKGLKHVLAKDSILQGSGSFILAGGIALVAALISAVLLRKRLGRYVSVDLKEQLRHIEGAFAPLVVITSCSVAFAHGANDVANSVGPLAAVVHIIQEGTVEMKVPVPFWVLALGGTGIVIGLATYGWKVMHTVGTEVTEMTPSRGVAADIAATTTVLICTHMKLPVSTTHTLVGAIIGVGLARGIGAVNMKVTRNIFGAWLITVPAAAGLAMVLFIIAKTLFL